MSSTETRAKSRAAPKTEEIRAPGTAQQEFPMKARPQKEHEWLQKLVGEWTYEGEMTMVPGKSPEKFEGTESIRSLGELWILAEGQGEMPDGSPVTTMLTLGYDPQREQFVGTFVASTETHVWLYDGNLDASQNVLTLNTEGPNMAAEGKVTRFKDVMEIKSDDHRVLTSNMLGDDEKWHKVMTLHYRRTM